MSGREVRSRVGITAAIVMLGACSVLQAQDNGSGNSREGVGPTASEVFTGSSTSISGGLMFDTNIGWNFTKNFGVDVGVPYMLDTRPGLFASPDGKIGYVNYPYISCSYFFGCYSGVATSSRMWTGQLGDVYGMVHYTRTYRKYNFATVATGDAPTASFRKGLTTGRSQWDWFNHIDTDVHSFTPFANFGLANGRMDQHFLPRPFETALPFRTLGYMSDFEGGLEYKVWRRASIGFSVWDVLPMGPQKIYSNLVWQDAVSPSVLMVGPRGSDMGTVILPSSTTVSGVPGTYGYVAGDVNHGRYWNSAFETAGPAYIDRDNGYSATLAFSPAKYVDVQIAYNRSVRYAMDGVVFTIAFNANSLFRKLTNY